MMIRRSLILGWMVAGLQFFAAGQSQPSQNAPAQSPATDGARSAPATAVSAIGGMDGDTGTGETPSDLPQIPALLGGTGITTAMGSELVKSNYLRAGINVGATYDDNPLLGSPSQGSNTSESIFPNLAIERSSSRMKWSLGYAGGLTVNQNFTNENQGSHNLNFDSQFRLSPHVNLRIAEKFLLTTGFFDAGSGTGEPGVPGGPNSNLITPLATQLSSLTTVETNYHFAVNDLVGARGSFYDLNYTNPQGTQQLTNSQTASGSAFWLHKFFRGDWGGVTYRYDHISYDPTGESRIHSFYAVNTLNLSNRFSLTGFIGPQYSENQGLLSGSPQTNDWSLAGGVDAGWQNLHTALSAGYSRTISDGGGLLGTVRLQNVHANFRRQIVPGWAAALNAAYGTNDSLTPPLLGTANSINLTSVGVSVERNVGKSVGFRMGYMHDFQRQQFASATQPQNLNASRNRFFVTLSYQWAKPLGM
jgi:hypothetical protein